MKTLISILFLILIFISCNQKEVCKKELKNDDKKKALKVDSNIIINSQLNKLASDTLKIYFLRSDWKNRSRNYFYDEKSICKLINDSLCCEFDLGWMGPDYSLGVIISNGKFSYKLMVYDCTYAHQYKIIEQSLTLNKSKFNIGDTIIGQIHCYGIDTAKEKIDTVIISGKFKIPVRSKYFTADSLALELNRKKLAALLLNERPDTISHLYLSYCGLTSLPAQLSKFKNIELLDLSLNNLKDADLSILCSFSKLKAIDLMKCNLSILSSSISCLKKIRKLNLCWNNLTTLPSELFQLENIRTLELGNNLLTYLPKEIVNLKNLEVLDISDSYKNKRNRIKKLPNNLFIKVPKLRLFFPPDCLDQKEYKDFKIKEIPYEY